MAFLSSHPLSVIPSYSPLLLTSFVLRFFSTPSPLLSIFSLWRGIFSWLLCSRSCSGCLHVLFSSTAYLGCAPSLGPEARPLLGFGISWHCVLLPGIVVKLSSSVIKPSCLSDTQSAWFISASHAPVLETVPTWAVIMSQTEHNSHLHPMTTAHYYHTRGYIYKTLVPPECHFLDAPVALYACQYLQGRAKRLAVV